MALDFIVNGIKGFLGYDRLDSDSSFDPSRRGFLRTAGEVVLGVAAATFVPSVACVAGPNETEEKKEESPADHKTNAEKLNKQRIDALFKDHKADVSGLVKKMNAEWDSAVKSYETVVRIDPSNVNAYVQLGDIYLDRLNFAKNKKQIDAGLGKAASYYKKAIALEKRNVDALLGLGMVLKKQKNYEQAVAVYQKVIKINPRSDKAYVGLSEVIDKKKNPDEYKSALFESLKINPKNAVAHNNLGFFYSTAGKKDQAIRQYKKAIELDPNLASAHNNLGWRLYKNKNYKEAQSELLKALQINPADVMASVNSGSVYFKQKDYNTSLSHFRKAQELDPDNKFAKAWIPYLKKKIAKELASAGNK